MPSGTAVDSALGEYVFDSENMNRWTGAIAVVTGVSSGVGQAVCERLLKRKINVVGISRRSYLIEEISKRSNTVNVGRVYSLECDLRVEEDIVKTFKWVDENLGAVGILVNAAGALLPTTLMDGATEMWKETLEVNFMGLTTCIREAIRSMQKHQINGQIISINCLCGHTIPYTPYPCYNIYASTKHALTALTENVRRELIFIKSKIKISMISPDIVNTELNYNVLDEADVRKFLTRSPALNPEDVADTCLFILGTPPHVGVHDIMLRAIGETTI